jgi:hypothetical protein
MAAALILFSGCVKESSEKQILNFSIASPAVEGVINESAKTIVVNMPVDTDLTALIPVITVSEKASVNPASGIVQDFTSSVTYVVTAEDGSTANYIVTVVADGTGGGGTGGGGTADPQDLSGSITENMTLLDLGLPVDYIIDGVLRLDGNSLVTIEPGVTIMFTGTDGGIEVGENAGLKMIGTAEKPIVFKGPANNPNIGSWNHIKYNSKRADNQMDYVYLLNGGSGNNYDYQAVLVNNGTLSMKNCVIDGSLRNGVVVYSNEDGYFTAFENNTIKNCTNFPLYFEKTVAGFQNIGQTNLYIDNGQNMIALAGSYASMTFDMVFNKQPIPYYFLDGMDFSASKTLTIEAGVEMLFAINTRIVIGEDVKFIAEGNASNPIIFRGLENESGYWRGMMYCGKRQNSLMSFCEISNVGRSEYWTENHALYLGSDSRLTLTNCTFSDSQYYGVVIERIANYGGINHSGSLFNNCQLGNVYIEIGGNFNGVTYESGQVLEQLP